VLAALCQTAARNEPAKKQHETLHSKSKNQRESEIRGKPRGKPSDAFSISTKVFSSVSDRLCLFIQKGMHNSSQLLVHARFMHLPLNKEAKPRRLRYASVSLYRLRCLSIELLSMFIDGWKICEALASPVPIFRLQEILLLTSIFRGYIVRASLTIDIVLKGGGKCRKVSPGGSNP
jgi:hypothetical protein